LRAATSAAAVSDGKVAWYIDSTGVASPGVPPAAVIAACCVASETLSPNETM
jgi:hypothetical protein